MGQDLKWVKQSTWHAVSECGNYEVRGRFNPDGNFWNAFHVPTGRLVCASGDKEFVKAVCEAHAISGTVNINLKRSHP